MLFAKDLLSNKLKNICWHNKYDFYQIDKQYLLNLKN